MAATKRWASLANRHHFKDDRLIIVINSAWPAATSKIRRGQNAFVNALHEACQINLTVICSWSAGPFGSATLRILLRCGRPVRHVPAFAGMRLTLPSHGTRESGARARPRPDPHGHGSFRPSFSSSSLVRPRRDHRLT